MKPTAKKKKSGRSMRLPLIPEGSRISVHLKTKVRKVLTAAGVDIVPHTRDGDLISALVAELKRRIPKDSGPASTYEMALATRDESSAKLIETWLAQQEEISRGVASVSQFDRLAIEAEEGTPYQPHSNIKLSSHRTYNILFLKGSPLPDVWLASHVVSPDPVVHRGNKYKGMLDVFTIQVDATNDRSTRVPVTRIELPRFTRIYVYELVTSYQGIDVIMLLDEDLVTKTVSSTEVSPSSPL